MKMKNSWIWIVLMIILFLWYTRSASGYSQPYMPFFNGKQFTQDDLAR